MKGHQELKENIPWNTAALVACISRDEACGGIDLRRPDGVGHAAISVIARKGWSISRLEEECALGAEERAYVRRSLAPDRHIGFLLGRLAARKALRTLGCEPCPERGIGYNVFGQPVVYSVTGCAVSITHTNAEAAAIAFPARQPVAIDLERLDRRNLEAVQSILTLDELHMARTLSCGEMAGECLISFILWTAREAVSKALGCGFMCNGQLLSVSKLKADSANGWHGEFAHLSQWRFSAVSDGKKVLSLVYPRRTVLAVGQP